VFDDSQPGLDLCHDPKKGASRIAPDDRAKPGATGIPAAGHLEDMNRLMPL
jgi:hypothetical protein